MGKIKQIAWCLAVIPTCCLQQSSEDIKLFLVFKYISRADYRTVARFRSTVNSNCLHLIVISHLYNELIHAKDRKDLPAFLFTVGDKDPLMTESFHALKKKLDEIGFAAKWSEDPVSHEWRVWERDIQKAFVFFGFSDEMKGNAF